MLIYNVILTTIKIVEVSIVPFENVTIANLYKSIYFIYSILSKCQQFADNSSVP